MLFVYHGDDVTKVRTEAFKKVGTLQNGDGAHIITPESGSLEELKDALGATSLFRTHEVYVLDTPSLDIKLFEALEGLLDEMQTSENTFILIEHTLSPKYEKRCASVAETLEKYTEVGKKDFNPFALSDALIARDKKTLWILLQAAWRDGKSSEELIGTLFWQLKMLRLAEVTKSATEAGQKPFVYDKAKRALKKFSEGEVAHLSHELVLLYHEGHTGKRVLGNALEAWVLRL